MAEPVLPDLSPGDVVESLRGRDRGTVALVWGMLGRQRAAIVDGDVHPVSHPKPKNRRHLRQVGRDLTIARRMIDGHGLSDGEIQAALAPFRVRAAGPPDDLEDPDHLGGPNHTEEAKGGSGNGQGG